MKLRGSAIEGMGMYLIAIILAVISIIIVVYLGGSLVSKIIGEFKLLLRAILPF